MGMVVNHINKAGRPSFISWRCSPLPDTTGNTMKKRFSNGRRSLCAASLTAVALVCMTCARAEDAPNATASPSMFALSGFGTLGMTHSSLDSADFTSTAFEPNGAGHSRAYDFADDTKLGVQLIGRFTDKLSAVVQVVSQHRYDNTFTPQIEWANLKYAFTPDFSVRVGRIELPTFLNSDYRNVGYANPWVRVPAEVYNTVPITNSDGADLSYRFRLGEVVNTVRVLYGYSAFHANPGMIKTTVTGIMGAFDTIEYRDFTVHVGYLHANVKLAVLDPKLPANVYSMAVGYDPGPWFVQAELARVTVDQLTPGYVSGYVTGGYRINKFTPFVTYSEAHALDHATIVPNYNMGQKDISAGVRWDFMKNMDLKVQFDHVWLPANSTGSFTNLQPNFQLGSGTNVFSAVLDFVF
jgi:hypothetical protein